MKTILAVTVVCVAGCGRRPVESVAEETTRPTTTTRVAADSPVPVKKERKAEPTPIQRSDKKLEVVPVKARDTAETMAKRSRYFTTCQQIIEEYLTNAEVADEKYRGHVVLVSNVFAWSKTTLADGRVVVRGRFAGGVPSEVIVYLDPEDAGEAAGNLNALLVVGIGGAPKGGAPVLEHARIVLNADGPATYRRGNELAGKK